MEIYEKIRYYREHMDYSQRNVAKILGVSRNTVPQSLCKKVCKKSANCDKIELISQEADFLWQEEKENR